MPTQFGHRRVPADGRGAGGRMSGHPRASVESTGEGTTTVSLHANGSATGSATVTVTLPEARVEVSPGSLTFEALGDTKSVTVRILDENGAEDEDATFSYFGAFSPCCRPDIADPPKGVDIEKVDGGLEITAEGPGSGQYTISSEGVESAILLVNVYMKPSTLEVSAGFGELGDRRDGHAPRDGQGRERQFDPCERRRRARAVSSCTGRRATRRWRTVDGAVTSERGATATATVTVQ